MLKCSAGKHFRRLVSISFSMARIVLADGNRHYPVTRKLISEEYLNMQPIALKKFFDTEINGSLTLNFYDPTQGNYHI
jgi:hypothetical protein